MSGSQTLARTNIATLYKLSQTPPRPLTRRNHHLVK
eukprot:CAMPEP_0204300520 /NCGR_PEP_ID=MMETSP0468-20130131/78743_1 /ASSEMBLY_ACC=CAM_ASM_000383 /TAXON_ID=2969 /ORGANISM="Oxyrrhis marina" /LENGTH=35 /DNA_ID= /DNA_START= /DNA_END= /DNA_ORIENTATION=